MPRLTIMPNGVTASCPRSGPLEEPAKRGVVNGWSIQATRRLRRWFFSVDGAALDGCGYAFTLTVRDLPPSAAAWTATRRAFVKRMERDGMVRGQWLTEWQRRGVPHLHGALYFEHPRDPDELATAWLEAAADWRPGREGQAVMDLWGLPGWLQYQAKHSSRGVRHYQRATVPAAWKSGTGRLWGALGEWPVRDLPLEVDMAVFWRFRRLMRAWLIAHARRAGEQRRVVYLRRMLTDPERARSSVRAVGEFCPEHVAMQLLHCSITAEDDERHRVERRPSPRGPQRLREGVSVGDPPPASSVPPLPAIQQPV